MNKAAIYAFLDQLGIWYEVTEHPPVFNMEEVSSIELPYPEADAKNLFVRDDKKRNYYLITLRGDKKLNLKEFRQENQTRALSFASNSDLLSILGLSPGSVTPFGLLNDQDRRVSFYLDDAFVTSQSLIGIHPNDNRATVWLKTSDLVTIIKNHGNEVHIVRMG